ncbi:WD repeat-containing protein 89 [Dufourea novaeangliae]|uniref:WD repeat-containing protein 89 n=1 Tax=Dufourea novaeangliae TaxID=178035 RepID=A0A154P8A6_DUFNO|nr:WD repeat-containing protein 89 [Dufourea novaeangliae]
MAKIAESFKKLSVEHSKRKFNDNRTTMKRKSELISAIEETVSLDNYILAVCGIQSDPEFRIGTALSDYTCTIHSVGESISKSITLTHNQAPIVGIRFSPTSKNILYTATSNGLITACDLRAKGKVIAEFKDCTEDGKVKPLCSFDVGYDERLIAGGTEHIGGDAFILFWDIRYTNSKLYNKNTLLGGYWQSHMEDVTCLAFHSKKQDVLASGSTDGLINVFDLTQPSEESALTYSLNTESSVDRIGWLNDNNLWCTTHTHSLQLWDCEGATPYSKFERSDLVVSQNDEVDNCYIGRFHTSDLLEQTFLIAGSSTVKGCLNVLNNRLEVCYNMVGNKQLVRDSWLHEKTGSLVTVGEGGLINIWRQAETTPLQENSSHKLVAKIGTGKGRDRQHRTKPY